MATTAFLILKGRVDVQRAADFRPILTLSKNSLFGEMALALGQRRSASVVAATRCEFLVITKDSYDAALKART